jgi:hypothetical protein
MRGSGWWFAVRYLILHVSAVALALPGHDTARLPRAIVSTNHKEEHFSDSLPDSAWLLSNKDIEHKHQRNSVVNGHKLFSTRYDNLQVVQSARCLYIAARTRKQKSKPCVQKKTHVPIATAFQQKPIGSRSSWLSPPLYTLAHITSGTTSNISNTISTSQDHPTSAPSPPSSNASPSTSYALSSPSSA